MNKNIKKPAAKKAVSKAKPVKKVSPAKKNNKKEAEDIFVDFSGSCDCSSCPSKCC